MDPAELRRTQLHPARRVPVQDPDRQHLRQRQLRGGAGPRVGDRRPASTGGRAGAAARRGALPRHRPGQLPGAHAATTPASGGSSTTTRRCPRPAPRRASSCRSTPWAACWWSWAARCGATARRPSSSQVIAEEFGIDPAGVAVTYADSTDRRDVRGPGRQPLDDHAVRGGPRRGAHDPGQDDPHRRARDGDEPRRRRVRGRHVPREGGAGHVDDDGRRRDARPPVHARQPGGRVQRAGGHPHLRPPVLDAAVRRPHGHGRLLPDGVARLPHPDRRGRPGDRAGHAARSTTR